MNDNKSGTIFLVLGFGVTFAFFLYIMLFHRQDNPDFVKPPSATPVASTEAAPTGGEPWVVTPEVLAKGKAHFQTYCTVCHGEQGHGDGPGGVALNPKPRNYGSTEGWKNGPSPFGIHKTIKNGLPGTSMVAFNLPEADIWAIAHYVRELAGPDVAKPVTPAEIEAFKKGAK